MTQTKWFGFDNGDGDWDWDEDEEQDEDINLELLAGTSRARVGSSVSKISGRRPRSLINTRAIFN